MTEIIDGKALAKKIRENLKKDVDELKKEGIKPKFAVILVGDDPASKIYVRNKNRACNEIGIEYEEHLSKDGETTRTKLFWKKEEPKSVSMFRTGEVSMACLFSSGERCACSYKTQDLTLEFFIVTKSVKNTLSLSGGSIGVSYNMEVKGITVSRNEYKLTVIK